MSGKGCQKYRPIAVHLNFDHVILGKLQWLELQRLVGTTIHSVPFNCHCRNGCNRRTIYKIIVT